MDKELLERVREGKIPEHIAIIMDGNRRWAKENSLMPWEGHKKGKETLHKLSEFQRSDSALPIKSITLYSLSEDNKTKRTPKEREELMKLFEAGFRGILKDKNIFESKVKISVFGDYTELPENVSAVIKEAIEKTKDHDQFFLNFCINYDGQSEIVHACKKIASDFKENRLSDEDITKELVKKNIFTSKFKAPELIIRSGGEKRLSAFMLWDSSYSEFYFSDKYWPDMTEEDIVKAIDEFQQRQRRYGQ